MDQRIAGQRKEAAAPRGAASRLSLAIIGIAALLLGGCAMTSSYLIDPDAKRACDSDVGSYYLSKTMFEVLITSDSASDQALHPAKPDLRRPPTAANNGNAGPAATVPDALYSDKKLISVKARAIADRSRGYCLDFLASPTAKEAINVDRTDGLLNKITTDSSDRSAEGLKNIIKTVLLASAADDSSGAGQRSDETDAPLQPVQLFKAAYDPLNPSQADMINHTLRQHGFCLVIENQKFHQDVHSIQDYCDEPLGHHGRREKALDKSAGYKGEEPTVQDHRGILYRPRVAYNYYLFVKRGNSWKLRKSVTVNLENTSPVIALGIDRAFFATRKTAVTFEQGVLKDVRVEKGSELASFVEVPLVLAQGVAALPANIVKVKVDITNQRSTLIAAQDQLLAAQLTYNKDVQAYQKAMAGQRTDGQGGQPIPPPPGAQDDVPFPNPAGNGALNSMRSDGASVPRAAGAPRSPPITQAATPPDSKCQLPCEQRGFQRQSCQQYCGCFAQCRVAVSQAPPQQQRATCMNYCTGYLP